MGDLSIKIKIANRVYPLTVKAEEEEGVRNSAEHINNSVEEYAKLYDVKDKQDLLAMAALKVATHNFKIEKNTVDDESQILENLQEVNDLLDKNL